MKVRWNLYITVSLEHLELIFCVYEDEELIKWGWPEDVWFHVDKLSSAHVYLRLNKVMRYSLVEPYVFQ